MELMGEILDFRDTETPTLISWVNTWLIEHKKPFVTDKTYHEICRYTRYIKNADIGHMKLADIRVTDLQKFINSFPRSRAKELVCMYLNAILEKATVLDLIEKNPFKAVTRDKRIKSIRLSLNLLQQKALLKAVKGSIIEDLVLFYLLTGVRRCEALSVKYDDLDPNECVIHIRGTKTANSIRDVHISKKYMRYLLKTYKNQKYLFPFPPDYVTKKLHRIFTKLEIPACVHCLRHTFSTNQMYLGTPDKFRQQWLGHASTQITNDVYTHIDGSLTRKNLQKLYKGLYYFVKRM